MADTIFRVVDEEGNSYEVLEIGAALRSDANAPGGASRAEPRRFLERIDGPELTLEADGTFSGHPDGSRLRRV